MAERRVRTVEGARLFGKPIGSLISQGKATESGVDRTVTLTRLVSLQRQFEVAKATGNLGAMRNIQDEYTQAVSAYRHNNQFLSILEDLIAARGRNDQAIDSREGSSTKS